MAYIELNDPTLYHVKEITHTMGRASFLKFHAEAQLGDADVSSARVNVRFTVNGVVWFAGKVLPVSRAITVEQDGIEYLAADFMEYLAHNPCDEVNRFYNRTLSDGTIYAYPDDKTIEDIITTEFASLVGTDKPIAALDFTDLGAAKDSVVYDFETKGRTFLELLQALAAEIPVMSWWLDPTTVGGKSVSGATLRFYDVTAVPDPPVEVRMVPKSSGSDPDANVLSIKIEEDISESYDTLTVEAGGDLQEYDELLTNEWDETKIGEFGVFLRENPTTQVIERLVSGAWTSANTGANKPWQMTSVLPEARFAYRRYRTSKEIVDFRITLDDTVSPARLLRAEQSMFMLGLKHVWYAGLITFIESGNVYAGILLNGVKIGLPYYADGATADSGSEIQSLGIVRPQEDLYPTWPAPQDAPRYDIGSPSSWERDVVMAPSVQVWRTDYIFNANNSGDSDYDAVANTPTFVYWPVGDRVWMKYTGRDPLIVTRTDATLGYDKHLHVYDSRFFKYTDLDGNVLRDDTAALNDFADALFALVKRKRYYGTVEVHTDPDTVLTDYPMGCAISVRNWQTLGNVLSISARVQSITLSKTNEEWTVELGFDNPQTYIALDRTRQWRRWFNQNDIATVGGTGGNGGGGGGGGGGPSGPGGPGGGGGPGNPGGGGGDGGGGATSTTTTTTTTTTTSSSTTTTTTTTSTTTSEGDCPTCDIDTGCPDPDVRIWIVETGVEWAEYCLTQHSCAWTDGDGCQLCGCCEDSDTGIPLGCYYGLVFGPI